MSNYLQGTVVKSVGGVFDVVDEQGIKFVCFSPKKFRYNDCDIFVGDKVQFEDLHKGKGNVTKVLPRKNLLYRPDIANIDCCFIVVASEPQPDFFLVDKVLVNCFKQNIEPVIVVNKTDLSDKLYNVVVDNYGKVANIVQTCAVNNDVTQLIPYIKGKTVCFAGQSAVGKTSLLNAILPDCNGQVGGISAKSGRGTHTTRHSSLHKVFDGFLVDTCGFSLCDFDDINSADLRLYLDEFVQMSHNCKYTSCTHTVEPDCAVKMAIQNGEMCRERYERYLEEYNELKLKEKNQY